MTDPRTRRRFLVAVGTASSGGVAGCLDDQGGDGAMDDASGDGVSEDGVSEDGDAAKTGSNGEGGENAAAGSDGDGTSLAAHPIGRGIDDRPHRGPGPTEAPATLVVLDDPSCPNCARFHRQTVEPLVADYAASGDLAVVSRPYPVIYPWGSDAAHALEATFDRDADAFWELLAYYFDAQNDLGSDDVYDRTRTWLEAETSLDAAAVVEDARAGTFQDRIDETIAAAADAGVGRTTPTSFAFLDGELQTTLTGSQSRTSVETVLQL